MRCVRGTSAAQQLQGGPGEVSTTSSWSGSEDAIQYTCGMSGRKLGGGRILGSGKSLAPPAPPAHQRKASDLISPAESVISSSLSSVSPLATSPLPDNIWRVIVSHSGEHKALVPHLQ
jgi:hypothetical protein